MIEENEASSLLSSVVGSLPLPFPAAMTTQADKYIAILRSRRVLDAVIDKFNLRDVYRSKYIEDVYKRLLNNVSFLDNEDGTVTIECLFKNEPETAAEMTNFFFVQAESVNIELSQERARKFREYMEAALEDAYKELTIVEDSLNAFQNEQAVINIEEQVKALVEQITLLESKKISLEVQKEYLESIHSADHPEIKELSNNIEILKNKIKALKESSDYSNIPMEDIPDIGLTYLRLYRNVQIKQKIIEFLVPQVEQAKIEEKKTSSNLVVLDWAVPFERKAKPKRAFVCIEITFLSLFLSIAYYWVREHYGITRERLKELFP